MRRLIFIKAILITFALNQTLMAQGLQTPDKTEPARVNTLSEQFNYIKQTSNRYEDYKVVKESKLNDFWKQVQDSIKTMKKDNHGAVAEIEQQKSEIASLKEQILKKNKDLGKNEYEISHIYVLGVPLQKDFYSYTLWSIILISLILSFVFYYKYMSSNTVTSKTLSEYEALQSEYTEHKKKCREIEMKLKRELQTERNTVEELSQVIATQRK